METDTSFLIQQDAFQGPIEVLLELIEKRKLFVGDVSLASVTDDFIAYIEQVGMHPDMVAHFLAVAATLILIKARSLLPTLELTEEESESISDLERRLALYQIMSSIARDLARAYGTRICFEGVQHQQSDPVFAPDPTLSVQTLPQLIADIVRRAPQKKTPLHEARVSVTISITEVLSTLQERIERVLSCNFSDITVASPDGDAKSQKVYTIVSFLGMLELVRRGLVAAEQHNQFDDIRLERMQHSSPS